MGLPISSNAPFPFRPHHRPERTEPGARPAGAPPPPGAEPASRSTAPAASTNPAEPSAPPAPAAIPYEQARLSDEFEVPADQAGLVNDADEAKASQGFTAGAKTVAQPTETTCGKATAASIYGASDPDASCEQLLDNVDTAANSVNQSEQLRDQVVVDLNDDTTSREMAALMGQGGKEVVRGFGHYDADALGDALRQGQFGTALIDSSALPQSKRQGAADDQGSLHWITIDGVNKGKSTDKSDDLYRVKDPVNGEYWLSRAALEKAVNKAQDTQGSGGMLLMKNRPDVQTQEQRDALTLENLKHTDALGSGGGVGIRRGSASESSYW